jgi:hypothetical protein
MCGLINKSVHPWPDLCYNHDMKADFYVYVIFRTNGVPCYVGKGRGQRWLRDDRRTENKHLASIMRQTNERLPRVKVRQGLEQTEAFEIEIALIAAIGREAHGGPLVNKTDGGEGSAGAKMSDEWRKTRSLRASEVWSRKDYRAELCQKKIGNQNSKKPHTLSNEWREELTDKMRGNTYTLGFVHSPEARAKMSIARKGKPKSAETRAKMAKSAAIGWLKRRRDAAVMA